MSNPTAEKLPAKIPKEIYAVTMEGIPTAYLLWHLMASVTDEGGCYVSTSFLTIC